jgi:hypothetical protein
MPEQVKASNTQQATSAFAGQVVVKSVQTLVTGTDGVVGNKTTHTHANGTTSYSVTW